MLCGTVKSETQMWVLLAWWSTAALNIRSAWLCSEVLTVFGISQEYAQARFDAYFDQKRKLGV